MKPINLSEKGQGPLTAMEMGEKYPCVTLKEDGAYELPDEGEITFSFEKKRYVEELENGEKKYSCTLELHEIVDVVDKAIKEPASNKGQDSEDALDKIRDEKMSQTEADEGEGY